MQSLLVLLALFCVAFGDYRLIQFNETEAYWMTEEAVDKLINTVPPVHFMDITDSELNPVQNMKVFTIPARPTRQTVVRPLIANVNADTIYSQIGRLAAFTTRYYTSQTGLQAVQAWQAQYRSYIPSGRTDIVADLYTHTWVQPSVVARITGTTRPNELVIIGGHIDSTSNGATAPGADDDASGSACVLEAFRILASDPTFRPQRTIEFHAYAAEEAGLRGSQAIATAYASRGANVVAMMQFDMTGFVRPGTTRTIGVVTDYTTSAVTAFIRLCVAEYITSGITWTNTQCGYACSDHASWYNRNFPAGFVFESTFANSSPYIHTPNDNLNTITRAHAADFARLALAVAVELSYQENEDDLIQ